MTATKRNQRRKQIYYTILSYTPRQFWLEATECIEVRLIKEDEENDYIIFSTECAQRFLYDELGIWFGKDEIRHSLKPLRYRQNYRLNKENKYGR